MKNLISIILSGTILFNSCNISDKQKNTSNKYAIKNNFELSAYEKEESLIIEKPANKTNNFKPRDKINDNYLKENTKDITLFKNERELKDFLIKEILKKDHTPRMDNPYMYDSPSQIKNLSLRQNNVIYLFLSSLEDPSCLNEIGEIIKKDTENKYSEIGGIINFKTTSKINLVCLKSESEELKDINRDGEYAIPKESFFMKKIAYFHLHATEYKDYLFAGPSLGDMLLLEGDTLESSVKNEFIITSLKKGKFNVDYVGIDTKKDKELRIIDLGNYSYDTLK